MAISSGQRRREEETKTYGRPLTIAERERLSYGSDIYSDNDSFDPRFPKTVRSDVTQIPTGQSTFQQSSPAPNFSSISGEAIYKAPTTSIPSKPTSFGPQQQAIPKPLSQIPLSFLQKQNNEFAAGVGGQSTEQTTTGFRYVTPSGRDVSGAVFPYAGPSQAGEFFFVTSQEENRLYNSNDYGYYRAIVPKETTPKLISQEIGLVQPLTYGIPFLDYDTQRERKAQIGAIQFVSSEFNKNPSSFEGLPGVTTTSQTTYEDFVTSEGYGRNEIKSKSYGLSSSFFEQPQSKFGIPALINKGGGFANLKGTRFDKALNVSASQRRETGLRQIGYGAVEGGLRLFADFPLSIAKGILTTANNPRRIIPYDPVSLNFGEINLGVGVISSRAEIKEGSSNFLGRGTILAGEIYYGIRAGISLFKTGVRGFQAYKSGASSLEIQNILNPIKIKGVFGDELIASRINSLENKKYIELSTNVLNIKNNEFISFALRENAGIVERQTTRIKFFKDPATGKRSFEFPIVEKTFTINDIFTDRQFVIKNSFNAGSGVSNEGKLNLLFKENEFESGKGFVVRGRIKNSLTKELINFNGLGTTRKTNVQGIYKTYSFKPTRAIGKKTYEFDITDTRKGLFQVEGFRGRFEYGVGETPVKYKGKLLRTDINKVFGGNLNSKGILITKNYRGGFTGLNDLDIPQVRIAKGRYGIDKSIRNLGNQKQIQIFKELPRSSSPSLASRSQKNVLQNQLKVPTISAAIGDATTGNILKGFSRSSNPDLVLPTIVGGSGLQGAFRGLNQYELSSATLAPEKLKNVFGLKNAFVSLNTQFTPNRSGLDVVFPPINVPRTRYNTASINATSVIQGSKLRDTVTFKNPSRFPQNQSSTRFNGGFNFNFITPKTRARFGIGGLGFGDLGYGTKASKRKYKRTPSLVALDLNIRSAFKGLAEPSGLSIRPILTSGRRKKKRKT